MIGVIGLIERTGFLLRVLGLGAFLFGAYLALGGFIGLIAARDAEVWSSGFRVSGLPFVSRVFPAPGFHGLRVSRILENVVLAP